MKETAIIIPTFNSEEVTINTIKKLLEQTYQDFDIIVVDCGSEDWKKIKEWRDKNNLKDKIIILHTEEDLGGAGSLYIGLKWAYEKGYKYFVLTDNDAVPIDDDLLEALISTIKREKLPTVALQKDMIAKARFVSNYFFHFLTISRKHVNDVGYPPAEFFIWADDMCYTGKLSKKFGKIICVDKKYVHYKFLFHKTFASRRALYNLRNYILWGYISHRKSVKKFFSIFLKVLLLLLYVRYLKKKGKYLENFLKGINLLLKCKLGKIVEYAESTPLKCSKTVTFGDLQNTNVHRATVLWKDILKYLRGNVKIKYDIDNSKRERFRLIKEVIKNAFKKVYVDNLDPLHVCLSKEIFLRYDERNGKLAVIKNDIFLTFILLIVMIPISILITFLIIYSLDRKFEKVRQKYYLWIDSLEIYKI